MTTTADQWWGSLLDSRFGIIRRLISETLPQNFPQSFHFISSTGADSTRWSDWLADERGAGYALHSRTAAVNAAVGEAIERYCGNLVPPTLRRAAASEFRDANIPHVDPEGLALYSPEQYAQRRFPFVSFNRSLVTDWIPGQDMTNLESNVWVPAALVYPTYPEYAYRSGLPVTNPVYQAGIAAGQDREAAELSALLEVVERDAMTLNWCAGGQLQPLTAPDGLHALFTGPDNTLEVRLFVFPNSFGACVVGALVRDQTTGRLALGSAARVRLEDAVRKAYGEALQLHLFMTDFDNPDGAYMSRIGDDSPLKPWRADRRYLDSYRPDLADVIEYGCHVQLFLDPRMQERFLTELEQSLGVAAEWTTDAGTGTPGADRQAIVEHMVEQGLTPVSVDVTTSDVEAAGTGARVVRVVVPGMYANSPVGRPFLGGDRLTATLAATGGYRLSTPLPH